MPDNHDGLAQEWDDLVKSSVVLIASGYDWQCPVCDDDEFHHVIELPNNQVVICEVCGTEFSVADVVDANE